MRSSKKIAAFVLLIGFCLSAQPARALVAPSLSAIQHQAQERRAVEKLLGDHRVINIVDDFLRFWEVAKDKSMFFQRLLWFHMVENKHRDYFERAVYRGASSDERRAMLDEFLIRVPSQVESIRELNRTIYSNLTDVFFNFKYFRFYEYNQQQDIYIGLSLFRFDGAVRPVGNEEGIPDTLCLAAEVLSGYTLDEIKIAITHEFFHLYHFRFLFDNPELEDFQSADMPLIIEGMAVAGTEECYPNYPDSLYLHFSDEELAAQQKEMSFNAARFLDLVRLKASPDRYGNWFRNSYESETPARGGYLLGYEVAKRMMAVYTLEQMVRMTPSELRSIVDEHLQEMAASGVLILASSK